VPPAAWRFAAGPHGRPEVAEPREHRGLRFNLSHTDGLVGCALVREHPVGFDVESLARATDVAPIAARFFAPPEAAALRALPAAARRRRFFDYWTLKEAYLKATGRGLSGSLSRFAFELAAGAPIRLVLPPGDAEDAAAWQFALLQVGAGHTAAVAVRRACIARFVLHARRVVPLGPARRAGTRVVAWSAPARAGVA
jgi:4'-phosphopantetheinyl transferase